MIVLKADKELNLTFQKLIKMMDVPVEWNGMCVHFFSTLTRSLW